MEFSFSEISAFVQVVVVDLVLAGDNAKIQLGHADCGVRDVIRRPAHPYTRGLLAALPTLDDIDAPLTPIPGDIPSPLERPAGCVYSTRCQEVIGPRCSAEVPQFLPVDTDHSAACHLYDRREGAA